MARKKRRQDTALDTRGRKNRNVSVKGKNSKQSKKRKKKGLPLGKKILVGFCTVLLVFVLVAIVGVAYIGNKMGKMDTKELDLDKLSISDELEYDESGYLNVALFGLDSRATDESMGSRSDTIIIASLNRETKVIKMASVYRDTLMQLDDGEYYKANAAYAYGEEEDAVAMLNRNLDMSITHYVTVDFSALVDVIDAVGGIEVDVTQEEIEGHDGYNINGYVMEVMENTGKESVGVTEPGLQTLNGVQATAYARIRYTDDGDLKRTERQRLVLTKVAEKLQSSNLATLDKIIDKVFPKVRTNFTLPEILAYAKDVKKFQFGENMGFPTNTGFTSYKEQGSVVISTAALEDVKELHRYFFGEDGYTPTSTVNSICSDLSYIWNSRATSTDATMYDDSTTYYDDGSDYTDNSTYKDDSNYYDDSETVYGDGTGGYGTDTGGTDTGYNDTGTEGNYGDGSGY